MRKITRDAINAFNVGTSFKRGNTRIIAHCDGDVDMVLHNHVIARKSSVGTISISHRGWPTNTTKERLNGIDGVSIYQKSGQWYLNDQPWNGEWIKVK